MSINAMIDAAVHCGKCGQHGFMKCACYCYCECGLIIERGGSCRSEAHSAEADTYLKNGYWVIGPGDKPYKSGTSSREVIRKRMEANSIFASRKLANAFVKNWRVR